MARVQQPQAHTSPRLVKPAGELDRTGLRGRNSPLLALPCPGLTALPPPIGLLKTWLSCHSDVLQGLAPPSGVSPSSLSWPGSCLLLRPAFELGQGPGCDLTAEEAPLPPTSPALSIPPRHPVPAPGGVGLAQPTGLPIPSASSRLKPWCFLALSVSLPLCVCLMWPHSSPAVHPVHRHRQTPVHKASEGALTG